MINTIQKKEKQSIADNFIEKYGKNNSGIYDILNQLNISVYICEINNCEIDGIIKLGEEAKKLNYHFSQYFKTGSVDEIIIMINEKCGNYNRRLVAARLLAYYLFQLPASNNNYSKEINCYKIEETKEDESALYFAECLLMPENDFKEKYSNIAKDNKLTVYDIINNLSEYFKVPPICITNRYEQIYGEKIIPTVTVKTKTI